MLEQHVGSRVQLQLAVEQVRHAAAVDDDDDDDELPDPVLKCRILVNSEFSFGTSP